MEKDLKKEGEVEEKKDGRERGSREEERKLGSWIKKKSLHVSIVNPQPV